MDKGFSYRVAELIDGLIIVSNSGYLSACGLIDVVKL